MEFMSMLVAGRMDLLSCNIVEKDCNSDVLWAWTYPSVTETQKTLILRKCSFDLVHQFLYGRYRNEWFYINTTEVFESDSLPGVKQFALVLWSRDFNPEKYETFCRILSKTYCKTGNPAMLLKLILSVVTRGACTTEENGTYFLKDFERSSLQNNTTMLRVYVTQEVHCSRISEYVHDMGHEIKWNDSCILYREADWWKRNTGYALFIAAENGPLSRPYMEVNGIYAKTVEKEIKGFDERDLIKLFELQTIVVYTALLLKKRLVIYHHSLPQLLKWVRTFPAMMVHRPEAENLYPWVDLSNDELDQLSVSQSYIVGCGDSRILSRVDLFDILVNLPAREITIAPHAKESMTMTKAHKEIALFLVQLADREGITEAQIIREIADKTQDLLSHLRSLASENTNGEKKVVTLESLRVKKFSPAVENFLLQLALAENLLV